MAMVTVEEAAQRLGLSVATIRRRLTAGKLAGAKTGRDWQVDDSTLPPSGPTRRHVNMAASTFSTQEIETAIRHVTTVDLSELWIPDILRWADSLGDEAALVADVQQRLARGAFGAPTQVRMPKSAMATRVGTLIDLTDRIAYQAAVARVARQVEKSTSPRVYSARTSDDRRYFLKRSVGLYVLWRKAYLTQLKARSGMLVTTDLSSYFDTIDQPTLLKELDELTGEAFAVDVLRKQLRTWAALMNRGIPQGPNASRLLGTAYLLPVDELMLVKGYDYWRYMDDIAIIVTDRAEASRAVLDFERACHLRGLLVSSAKTSVQSLPDAMAESGNAAKDNIDYLTRAGSRQARVALMKIFFKAVPREGPIDVGDTKFSVWRLAQALDRGPLKRIIARIADLGPVASVSAAYLRHFLTNPNAARAIGDFLNDSDRNTSTYLESWLFAAALEHPTRPPEPWLTRARIVAVDKNAASHHRVLAINVLALGAKAGDIGNIRKIGAHEHDPEVVRGAVVALARVSKLDGPTIAAVQARHSTLLCTLTYLQGRGRLPSLVYRGRTVAVRRA
jgi:excisionase family DNA binding protein